MSTDIWVSLGGDIPVEPIAGTLMRMTESQEQVATSRICNNLAEQSRLEELLEEKSKPPLPDGVAHLNYLLATPWRYPPLLYGSRFGRVFEPSLFYGALSVDTCLAESAYYRLVLLLDMSALPDTPLRSRHTLFEVKYKTAIGLKLQGPAFQPFSETLTHPSQYGPTQSLGSAMREFGIEAFEYASARDPNRGNNVALFTPKALSSRKVSNKTEWQCETTEVGVMFSFMGVPARVKAFESDLFMRDGQFPRPA